MTVAYIESWFDCELTQPVRVDTLGGNLFSMDNGGNQIGVRVFKNGEPESPGGSLFAKIIRPDGGTVTTDSVQFSGNSAAVLLPQAAYAYPGVVTVSLKHTSGSTVTTLAAFTAYVYETTTDTPIDPGTIIPSVEQLIAAIAAAEESIPAAAPALMAAIASTFSNTVPYQKGQYVWNGGSLYQFTAAHPAGAWTGTDAVLAAAGSDFAAYDREHMDGINLIKTQYFMTPVIGFPTGQTGTVTRNVSVPEWGCDDATRVVGTKAENSSVTAFYIGGTTAEMLPGYTTAANGQLFETNIWVKNNHETQSIFVKTALTNYTEYEEIAPGKSAKIDQIARGSGSDSLQIRFKTSASGTAGDPFDVTIWHPVIKIGTATNVGEYVPPAYTPLTGKPTANQTPEFGGTFTVSQVKTDSLGNVSELVDKTVKIPDTIASTSAAGLMSAQDKVKLNACKTTNATESASGLMSADDKAKLNGLEVGARNLLLNSSEPLIGSSNGATYTVARNVEVSEWGATSAIRVAGTGASGVISKSVFYIGGVTAAIAYGKRTTVSGQNYSYSIYIKNNHATENCGIFSPLKSVITIAPGESTRVEWSVTGDGSGLIQIIFQSGSYGGAFDITFWHPMIELGTFSTDWTPALEDNGYVKDYIDGLLEDNSHVYGYSSENIQSGGITVKRIGKLCTINFNQATVDKSNVFTADTETETGIILASEDGHVPYMDYWFILVSRPNNVTVLAKIAHSTGKLTLRPFGRALSKFDYLYGSASYFV